LSKADYSEEKKCLKTIAQEIGDYYAGFIKTQGPEQLGVLDIILKDSVFPKLKTQLRTSIHWDSEND
jgi:hypothetical protein